MLVLLPALAVVGAPLAFADAGEGAGVVDEASTSGPFEPAPKPRRWSILPVPTIDYTPETGPSAGGVALVTMRPWKDTRPSTFELEATVTWKLQVMVETTWQVYTRRNDWRIAGNVAGMRYPETWWGVGPDTPDGAAEDYDAWRVEIAPSLERRVWRDLYVGPSWELQWMFGLDPTPGGLLDGGGVVGADGGVSSGVGYTASWDTRANPSNPTAGSRLLSIRQHLYDTWTGSAYRFTTTTLDTRAYLGTWPGHVVAMQAFVDLRTGEPPFRKLAMLGGDTIGRGYWYGRVRDQHLLAGQVEYRAPIWWRFGAVLFVGVAEVTPDLARHAPDWLKPTFGGGLRVRLVDEEQLNLRVDYAQGLGSSGIYFGFGEVF